MNRDITGFPIEISPDRVRMCYKHYPKKRWAFLDLCPATQASVTELVGDTLGIVDLSVYFDYHAETPAHFDFLQYVVRKP